MHQLGDKKNHFGIIRGIEDRGDKIYLSIEIEPPEQPEFFIEAYNWLLGTKVEVNE